MIPEGNYTGTITGAWCERDNKHQSDALVMCFGVEIEGHGEHIARHDTEGKNSWSGKGVAKLLGIEWPDGLSTIDDVVGREVPVRVKHNTSQKGDLYCNVYIQAPRESEPATKAQIAAGIERIKRQEVKDDDNIPF